MLDVHPETARSYRRSVSEPAPSFVTGRLYCSLAKHFKQPHALIVAIEGAVQTRRISCDRTQPLHVLVCSCPLQLQYEADSHVAQRTSWVSAVHHEF